MCESEWVPRGHGICPLSHPRRRPAVQDLPVAVLRAPGAGSSHLRGLLPVRTPWTFQEILDLESELGVTSAFYFLNEQDLFADRSPRDWLSGRPGILRRPVRHRGRRSSRHPRDRRPGLGRSASPFPLRVLRRSARCSPPRSATSRTSSARVLSSRQHYLNIERPETWTYQRTAGLQYDATPGSSCDYGFHDGYDPTGPSTASSSSSC